MEAPERVDYKSTLHLPKTAFAMKADLARREPELCARWEADDITARILEARAGARTWVLHDGPPYANGHIHYGHILNKVLKDIIVKSRTMMGCRVEYRPGFDCHGLPIELAVLRELGAGAANAGAVEVRAACHAYAMRWVATQTAEFKRLGIFGSWDTPYRTLDRDYEATVVRQLAAFARMGLLYRDKKPVHWCMTDRTALAEAEIEYDDAHVSPSIYVAFALPEEGTFAVIWTTTPWTLPANQAIAYNPAFEYVLVRARGARYAVARKLADEFVKANGLVEEGAREALSIARLAGWGAARHPFMERDAPLLPADYVTLEAGTGLVHTAPGHGADDFATGRKHGLPIDAPVDDDGRFTAGPWAGEHVFAANPRIIAALHASGALLSPPAATTTHSYPICWRCKSPVIFRGTEQWFARMDAPVARDANGERSLRAAALDEIAATTWIPAWGSSRIGGMIENRPDWVLSRQRAWGVPIPVFYDLADGGRPWPAAPAEQARVMEHVAALIEKDGVDAWFTRGARELLPPDLARDGLAKGQDIVDVWFESGVSWAAVCEGRRGLDSSAETANGRPGIPADLYLEGSDQHRGWFHSALLTSVATRGHAPYRAVLTHGFVMDEHGRPYSKSEIEKARRAGLRVEYIPPEDVLKTQGAELLRLWTAASDFRGDIGYSRAHLTQLGESYRKLRNTARFLLGNLADFDPARHDRPEALTDPLDRWAHGRTGEVIERVRAAYEAYELHVVFRTLIDWCAGDLSAVYLDVRKDRLYCDAAPPRRATQTVLYGALRALTLLSAPVLAFTAEEIWSHTPRRPGDPASVHVALWPEPWTMSVELAREMAIVLGWRSAVQAALEGFRAQKKDSLDARIELPAHHLDALAASSLFAGAAPAAAGTWLADLLLVSQVGRTEAVTRAPAAGLSPLLAGDVVVVAAAGHCCDRCWKTTPDAPICARCRAAIEAADTDEADER